LSYGEMPYINTFSTFDELVEAIVGGYRAAIPPNTPVIMAKLIKSCWSALPKDRPTFQEMLEPNIFSKILDEVNNNDEYWDVEEEHSEEEEKHKIKEEVRKLHTRRRRQRYIRSFCIRRKKSKNKAKNWKMYENQRNWKIH